jgi:PAS domain S-box-containing protein
LEAGLSKHSREAPAATDGRFPGLSWLEGGDSTHRRTPVAGSLLIVGLVLVYVGLSVYFRLYLHLDIVYTHFAYLPISLAGLWWGRRAALVAGFLGLLGVSIHLVEVGTAGIWADLVRTGLFLIVGLCIGVLSDRVLLGRRTLLRSEKLHRLLVEKTVAGLLLVQRDEIVFCNAQLGQILGRPPEAFAGLRIWDLVHPDDRPALRDLVPRLEAGEMETHRSEVRLIGASGDTVWADLGQAHTTVGGHSLLLLSIYDISARRHAEMRRRQIAEIARSQEQQIAQSGRLAALGEMAAAIAHELNQPLTGIQTFANKAIFMIDEKLGDDGAIRDNLEQISTQVARASKVISRSRALTRTDDRDFSELNVNAVLSDIIDFIQPQLALSHVETRLELDDCLPAVRGDRVRLEQVFLNILTNARQAMEDSEEKVLTVRTKRSPGERITVEVADTGIGFEPADAEGLFKPFYTTKEAGKGTGLGLAISLRIIKEHGGTIDATGAPGEGARFTISLPEAGTA